MPRMAWRVVCGWSVIATFCPTSALVSVDLPAFGRPTKQAKPPLRPTADVNPSSPHFRLARDQLRSHREALVTPGVPAASKDVSPWADALDPAISHARSGPASRVVVVDCPKQRAHKLVEGPCARARGRPHRGGGRVPRIVLVLHLADNLLKHVLDGPREPADAALNSSTTITMCRTSPCIRRSRSFDGKQLRHVHGGRAIASERRAPRPPHSPHVAASTSLRYTTPTRSSKRSTAITGSRERPDRRRNRRIASARRSRPCGDE